MRNQTILVLLGPSGDQHALQSLLGVAHDQNAHLSVMHVGPVEPIPFYAYGGMPYGAVEVPHSWVENRKALAKSLEQKRDDMNAYLTTEGVSGDASVICNFTASLHEAVNARAAMSDLVVFDNDLRAYPDAFRNMLFGVLFDSPVGAIINPHKTTRPANPEHVFVAWDNSEPAAGAVHRALPLLKAATKITIATFDAVKSEHANGEEPGADLASWLSHHGCDVTVEQFATGSDSVGASIQKRAAGVSADLVVMGAYGHTRLREAVFGGTTRSMVEQEDIAVFLGR